jgi:uncharacterized damage-inducible protein DinB
LGSAAPVIETGSTILGVRMDRIDHIRLMADYNAWMNRKLCEAAAKLTPGEVAADRGAFFKSLLGTLNHLFVADTIWLKRFAGAFAESAALQPVQDLAAPTSLDQVPCADLPQLVARRRELDAIIDAWCASLRNDDLDRVLSYVNMLGVVGKRPLYGILIHLFNHQTHHRGQATTLLSQAGIDVGVTDLVTLIPNLADA